LLERGIADLGFSEPTPIQLDGIPPALEGNDVLGCAMTGSGKTAAFALPILDRLLARRRGATRALVLAPTRELAAQIVEHTNELARHTKIKAAAVFGGVGMAPQVQALKGGVDIVVACPGRLLDHMQYPYARFDDLEVLVLDEADRMLDMGFLPDIRRILRQLPEPQQTLFFSATVPREIAQLARQMLHEPTVLNIERPAAPATGVRQSIYPVRSNLKPSLLLELVERGVIDNALCFTRTKHRANRLARFLDRRGVRCDKIHGNRSQTQRTKALADFKHGRIQVLVATDVAARGIDIEALSHVVNVDVPKVPDDYIHRVGRTARAGLTGEAFTFVSRDEEKDLRDIERKVGKRLPRKILDDFDYETSPAERFEVPVRERIAQIRAQRDQERARSRARAEAKAERQLRPPSNAQRPRRSRRRHNRSLVRGSG
jgi:ATP-dependent RNA helicase RhlE